MQERAHLAMMDMISQMEFAAYRLQIMLSLPIQGAPIGIGIIKFA